MSASSTRAAGRNDAVVHADTDDARGIDVAFIYDPGLLQAPDDQVFFHVVIRRNASRELVQVNFQTHTTRTWTVFGNHWPWRSGTSLSPPAPRHRGRDAQLLPPARARGPRRERAPLAMGDFKEVLLDTFLVRSVLVPTLDELIGPKIWWPSRLAREEEQGGPREAGERLAVEA